MRIPASLLLLALLSGPLSVSAEEITVETITDSYGLPLAYIYLSGGREIARQNVSAMQPFDLDQIPAGVPDGVITFHHADGFRMEVPREDGKVNGIVKGYDPGGKLTFEEHYIDGKPGGTSKEYYASGQVADERTRQEGGPGKTRRVFYKNGTLKSEEDASEGKPRHITSYDRDGRLSMEQVWEGGKYVIRYYRAGRLNIEKTQIGRKVVNVKEYDDKGDLVSDTDY